jgi:peptidoglycan/LPS O-acetylase OafA/YrhL
VKNWRIPPSLDIVLHKNSNIHIMTPNKYRPDIDGLRAIAVLSVVLHHLNASLVPGGFVGVDIFFVISGYLITSQVNKEACEGTFSLKQFYKRRINRIVPALVTVVVATLVVGAVLLSPADLIRLSKSMIYAMLGLSNIFFWREYGNYFAGNASEAPLLHTWSLGVEEQFYVVWPLLILLFIKLSRRHMVGILVILTIGAIAVSQIAIGIVASASYYLLPTRFFELMIGGLLALIAAHKNLESQRYSGVFASIGLILIGGSLFLLNKSSPFPGINALWPCLGAALLILAGNTQHFLSRILTNQPMVFIGLISYSLYLWHWPIIAYLNYLNIAIGPFVGSCVVVTAILLAWLSWRFVETPFRKTGTTLSFAKVFLRRFAIPLVVLLSIGAATAYTQGFSTRFDPQVSKFESILATQPEILRSGCHVPTAMYDTPPNIKCRLGADKPELDGMLIGDSHANHFSGMIDVMAKFEGISLMDYTMDGCSPILGYDVTGAPTYAERCRKRNKIAYAKVSANHFPLVVLAASWPKDLAAGKLLMSSIDAILGSGAKLTLILRIENIKRSSSCPIRRMMYGSTESCEGPREGFPKYFNEIRMRYPTVNIIDPNQATCNGDKCIPMIGDVPLYRDDSHLNDIGSRLIGKSLLNMGVTLLRSDQKAKG